MNNIDTLRFGSGPLHGTGSPYIEVCPIGCREGFDHTSIVLPEGPLRRCRECGHLVSHCNEERYYESMKEFDVPEGTFPGSENLYRHVHRSKKILGRIAQILNKRASDTDLLDVGCSSGAFLVVAREYGFKVAGVEPAAAAAKTAREMQFVIYEGRLESLPLDHKSWDVITMFEVIEHIKDPLLTLKKCNRLLRSHGILVLCTGNTESWTVKYMAREWEYFDMAKHGGHISFFSPMSVRVLAERTGFEIADLRTRNVRFCGKARGRLVGYRVAKIAGEAVNGFARLFGKGHDMLVIMRKRAEV